MLTLTNICDFFFFRVLRRVWSERANFCLPCGEEMCPWQSRTSPASNDLCRAAEDRMVTAGPNEPRPPQAFTSPAGVPNPGRALLLLLLLLFLGHGDRKES